MPLVASPGRAVRSARWLVLVPVFTHSLARAQAPGEVMPAVPTTAPPPALGPGAPSPTPVTTCVTESGCSRAPTVMDNRWAIGASLGSLGVEGQDDDSYQMRELALRFRATLHLELEMSLASGEKQSNRDLGINSAALAVRYRLWPENAWNVFAMAGLGAAAIAFPASSYQPGSPVYALGMLGLGLEWRFAEHLAIQLEAREIGLTRNQAPHITADIMPGPPAIPPAEQSAASVAIGLSCYF
jgi:hypothetical protein